MEREKSCFMQDNQNKGKTRPRLHAITLLGGGGGDLGLNGEGKGELLWRSKNAKARERFVRIREKACGVRAGIIGRGMNHNQERGGSSYALIW